MRDGEPRIERVTDRTHPHRGVVDLEVMPRIPGERADAVAERQPERHERAREPVAPFAELRVRRPHDDASAVRLDDLAVAEPLGGVIEKLVDGEAVGLHARTVRVGGRADGGYRTTRASTP